MPADFYVGTNVLAEFCKRNHIRRLAVFGSALGADFNDDSDIDVLVEFDPEHVLGFRFVALEDELARLFGRQVDLNTRMSLHGSFRDRVTDEARVLYASAAA